VGRNFASEIFVGSETAIHSSTQARASQTTGGPDGTAKRGTSDEVTTSGSPNEKFLEGTVVAITGRTDPSSMTQHRRGAWMGGAELHPTDTGEGDISPSVCLAASRPCILILQNNIYPEAELVREVTRHGFDIGGPFNKLAHAFTWLETEIPDAAILDIALLDGVSSDLARELHRKNIPMMFYSAWREIYPIPAELENVPFLEKPVHSVLLPTLLSNIIVGRQAAQAHTP
jgi:hypothetical protein